MGMVKLQVLLRHEVSNFFTMHKEAPIYLRTKLGFSPVK